MIRVGHQLWLLNPLLKKMSQDITIFFWVDKHVLNNGCLRGTFCNKVESKQVMRVSNKTVFWNIAKLYWIYKHSSVFLLFEINVDVVSILGCKIK